MVNRVVCVLFLALLFKVHVYALMISFSTVRRMRADGGDLRDHEGDGADLCEVVDSELATARSRTPQLPPRFTEASHTARTFVFVVASLL